MRESESGPDPRKEAAILHLLRKEDRDNINSISILHKLVFLAQEGGLEEDAIPEGEGQHFGIEFNDTTPIWNGRIAWSDELHELMQGLERYNLIETKTYINRTPGLGPNPGHTVIKITDKGVEEAEFDRLTEDEKRVLWAVKKLYNNATQLSLNSDIDNYIRHNRPDLL